MLGTGLLRHLQSDVGRCRRMPKIAKKRIPEAAAVGVVVILALTAWLGSRYVSQAGWVRHTLEVQTEISAIWSLLQDVEIGQRSYVLTGDERFLEPYTNGARQLPGEMDKLTALVIDNAEARCPSSQRRSPSSTSASVSPRARLRFAAREISKPPARS